MVIFGAGVMTGGLLVRQTILVHPPKPPHTGSFNRTIPNSPGVTRIEFLRRAERELNLTPDQKAQADKIIIASQERTKIIMEPVAPRIREELQQTRDQFRAVLTPEQQTRFDEFMKKQMRPREPHRSGGKALENPTNASPVGHP
jgi:hypothetical protein